MCLYPKLIKNPKYKPNKKNGYKPPVCEDKRFLYITAACGKCYECRKQKQNQWLVRMQEELKDTPNAIFTTLTINDENYKKLAKEAKSEEPNDIAKLAIRRYLERVRKKTGKSQKHWYTTEIGGNSTERLHLHGIEWNAKGEFHTECWGYGFVFVGGYVNEKTINYVTKYMTKIDEKHKDYQPIILCSAGIGAGYINRTDTNRNRFKGKDTNTTYKAKNGAVVNLPMYYRNKLYTEKQKEQLWGYRIDLNKIWVCGEKTTPDTEEHRRLLEYYQDYYRKLCSEDVSEWNWIAYRRRLEKLNKYRNKTKEEIEKDIRKQRKTQINLEKESLNGLEFPNMPPAASSLLDPPAVLSWTSDEQGALRGLSEGSLKREDVT